MSLSIKLAKSYVGLAKRHPWLLLAGYIILTVVATIGTVAIFSNVSMDFRNLLPEDTPSRLALETNETRRGSSDLYTIAVESPDPYANVALIDALAARIESDWDEAIWVQTTEDPSFFQDHALLYLPTERLERFRDDLRAALRCELQEVNAAFVEVGDACEDSQEVEWTFDAWLGEDAMKELGLPESFFGSWADMIGTGDSSNDAAEPSETAADEGTGAASEEPASSDTEAEPSLPSELEHYIISEDGRIAVLSVQLSRPSTDVEFANAMQQRGTELIAELDPSSFNPEMRAEVVGAFQSLNEAKEAVNDSFAALLASLGMIVLVMLAFFRAIRGLMVVFIPLIMGLTWTMGLSWFTYHQLNLYTMFVGSVLLGMGIDFGIHIYGRALESFRAGSNWEESLVDAL
ncbi:MAG: MMPL family transporter, partial [Myxococcales bacterium]|nr:MMPL family transporter [Myxococcales bacterium]